MANNRAFAGVARTLLGSDAVIFNARENRWLLADENKRIRKSRRRAKRRGQPSPN